MLTSLRASFTCYSLFQVDSALKTGSIGDSRWSCADKIPQSQLLVRPATEYH